MRRMEERPPTQRIPLGNRDEHRSEAAGIKRTDPPIIFFAGSDHWQDAEVHPEDSGAILFAPLHMNFACDYDAGWISG